MNHAAAAVQAVSQRLAAAEVLKHLLDLAHSREEHENGTTLAAVASPSQLQRVTPHTSHLTPHTSHLTPHTSHLTPHTSHHTQTSHLTPHTYHITRCISVKAHLHVSVAHDVLQRHLHQLGVDPALVDDKQSALQGTHGSQEVFPAGTLGRLLFERVELFAHFVLGQRIAPSGGDGVPVRRGKWYGKAVVMRGLLCALEEMFEVVVDDGKGAA